MNYYERHIGDYARDTGYLSVLEHGIYCLLLDRYYATEQPIPANKAHRIARAHSKKRKALLMWCLMNSSYCKRTAGITSDVMRKSLAFMQGQQHSRRTAKGRAA